MLACQSLAVGDHRMSYIKEAQAWLIFVAVLHSLHACRLSARLASWDTVSLDVININSDQPLRVYVAVMVDAFVKNTRQCIAVVQFSA